MSSCHRFEHCYRPTVCPTDSGLFRLQLPYTCVLWFSYMSMPVIPLPDVLSLLSLCSVTVSFPMSRPVTQSLSYRDVGRHLFVRQSLPLLVSLVIWGAVTLDDVSYNDQQTVYTRLSSIS
ncbi:hypothetical protein ARMSODRAFT_965935 [Armillaria solidipes]|uniref:Uncharacterized protein n=1 Tax=Armillaria solidipes TaxID=1076256 RepID=A0A2H3AP97_9AGAR|nr:hypothetical protein ARMSODRAFT_965935 [Armillaria solidipes]